LQSLHTTVLTNSPPNIKSTNVLLANSSPAAEESKAQNHEPGPRRCKPMLSASFGNNKCQVRYAPVRTFYSCPEVGVNLARVEVLVNVEMLQQRMPPPLRIAKQSTSPNESPCLRPFFLPASG
jgi:hypothetical protein